MFEFANGFLTNYASLLLFLPEFKIIRDDIGVYAASYAFTLANDWWAINILPICLPIDTKITVHYYLKSSSIFFKICGLYLLFDIMTNNYFLITKIQHCI